MRRSLLPLLALFVFVACEDSPSGPSVGLAERFTLARGETASVRDSDVRVQFVEVTGDSRCPADAICIQGGDAVVRVRVRGGGDTATYELHTGDSSRARVRHEDFAIELVQLEPYPFGSRPPIQPGDYRATLLVTR